MVCEYSQLTKLRLTDGFSEKVKFVPKIDECQICPNLWNCNLGRREIITEKEEGDLAAYGIRSDQSGSKLKVEPCLEAEWGQIFFCQIRGNRFQSASVAPLSTERASTAVVLLINDQWGTLHWHRLPAKNALA